VSERTVKHDTIVMERKFKSSPAKVFAAWKDPEAYGRWNRPGEDWVMAEYENDFRVGGREKKTFGPKEDPRYVGEGTTWTLCRTRGSSRPLTCANGIRGCRRRCARWSCWRMGAGRS
jgi:hypothetical protein